MLFSKTVAATSILIAVISEISGIPSPSIIRERHIIHAPIKFRTIHHYSVKKIPVIITKHLHYYKQKEDIHHIPQLNLEESHENQIHHDQDDHQYLTFSKQEKHIKDSSSNGPKYPPYEDWKPQDDQEEEYDEREQSQEEYDEDYEYE